MFKHLKNFLIAIVLTFSFIGSVKAYVRPTIQNKSITDIDFTYNGVRYNYEKLSADLNYALTQSGLSLDNFTSFIMVVPTVPKTDDWPQYISLYLFDTNITSYQLGSSPNNDGRIYFEPNLTYAWSIAWRFKQKDYFYGGTSTNTDFWAERIHTGSSTSNTYEIYSNTNWFNIPNLTANAEYNQYTILNVDNSLFDTGPTIFNFHLNGGHGTCVLGIDPPTPVIPILHDDENFSISTDDYDIYDVLDNLEIEKDNMIFDGFYYDSNFTQPFNINDNFDEHATVENDAKVINLYAKYRYKTVDDFLANTDFTTYTFDTNYDYAIINRGNNSDIVYMGLPFNSYNLEVYEYQENTGTYKNGSSVCLVPIFNKGGWYMYELNTLFTNNQEVLIIPRYLFDELDPNSFEDPSEQYNFYLTQNAYVTYTNDLTHVTITNSQGQTVDTNLQNSFELSQQYQEMYAHEKDIYAQIKIFLNNLTRYTTAIRQLFEYLFNSLNSTIRNFIIFIVVIILLSAILRAIRRG